MVMPLHSLFFPIQCDIHNAATPQMTSPLAHRRVLVVDDHADAARMFELLLQCEGHETRTAHDGPMALKAVEDFKPDFVFLDIGMPGMNGYQIASKLKDSAHRRNMFLVALTGWGEPSDFEQTRRAGFDFHLVKPTDTASIRRLLENPPKGWSETVSMIADELKVEASQ